MFKDVFTLKKKSWHTKMMNYIWGLDYRDFSHMCPYWWLSVANVIIIGPLFVIKESFRHLGKAFMFVIEHLDAYFEHIKEQERAKWIAEYQLLINDEEKLKEALLKKSEHARRKLMENLYNNGYGALGYNGYYAIKNAVDDIQWDKKRQKKEIEEANTFASLSRKYTPAKTVTPKDPDFYKIKQELERKQAEEEAARLRRNKDRIVKILKIVKPVLSTFAYIVGTVVVLICAYYLIMLFVWVYNSLANIPHVKYVMLGKHIMYGTIGLVMIGSIVLGLVMGLKYIVDHEILVPGPKTSRRARIVFRWVGVPFVILINTIVTIATAIGKALSFLIMMLKNQCPAIKWED